MKSKANNIEGPLLVEGCYEILDTKTGKTTYTRNPLEVQDVALSPKNIRLGKNLRYQIHWLKNPPKAIKVLYGI